MEAFLKGPERAGAVEVLFFENAEVEKTQGEQKIFSSAGNLAVLYFKDYHRFVLQINDWKYPLLRRLPATSSSQTDTAARTYTLAGLNNSQYSLRILNANGFALSNFETILKNQSNFSYFGENLQRKIEASPDDKVVRAAKKDTGAKEYITGMVKGAVEKVKNLKATATTGTKNINSRKEKLDLKAIKNKNFKKQAKSTFKKDYFAANEKLSKEFLDLRWKNTSNNTLREWTDLSKTAHLPIHWVSKMDIENAILNNKDIAAQGNYGEAKKIGLMDNIKGTVSGVIQNTRSGLNNLAHDIANRVHPATTMVQPADKTEQHYQG